MKIAVTYENSNVFQHFGHSEQFKIYDVDGGKIADSRVVSTNGKGHGALAQFLAELGVDTLICGGIGEGAKAALSAAKIDLYGGVTGNADDAVNALLAGNLSFNSDIHCEHHHNHDNHHNDNCGEEKRGCSGNDGCHKNKV